MSEEENQSPRQNDADPITPKMPKPGLLATLRNNFFAGVVVAAPISITIAVVYWLITGPLASLDGFVQGWIPDRFKPEINLDQAIPGFGVAVAIVGLVLLGTLAKNFIGRAFIRTGERVLDSMPVVRNVYGFAKNVFEMALAQSDRSFKEMVLIEYPRPGLWVLGFVVTSTKGEISHKLMDLGEDLLSIFVPTTPNPTSGFLVFVPRANVRMLDMTVEEGAKAIFSAGLVTPEYDPANPQLTKRWDAESDTGVKENAVGEKKSGLMAFFSSKKKD